MRRTLLASACAAAAVLVVSPSDRALAGAGAFAAHAGKGQVHSSTVATPIGYRCRRCDDGCSRPPAYGYYAVPQPVYVPTYSYYAPSVVYQGPFGIYRPYPPTVVYDYPPPYRSYYSDWRYSRW